MDDNGAGLLHDAARLAADLGPALRPVPLRDLLASITDAAKHIFGAMACSVALLDEEAQELVFYVASSAAGDSVAGQRVPVGTGIAGWAFLSGQAVEIADVQSDPRFDTRVAAVTGYVPRSILAMPLATEHRTLGVIEVLDRDTRNRNSADDLELLSLIARQAALAIETTEVFSDLGRVLFAALAHAAGSDTDLRSALEAVAAEARKPMAQLAELAASFADLAALGEAERSAANRIVANFLAYARSKRRR